MVMLPSSPKLKHARQASYRSGMQIVASIKSIQCKQRDFASFPTLLYKRDKDFALLPTQHRVDQATFAGPKMEYTRIPQPSTSTLCFPIWLWQRIIATSNCWVPTMNLINVHWGSQGGLLLLLLLLYMLDATHCITNPDSNWSCSQGICLLVWQPTCAFRQSQCCLMSWDRHLYPLLLPSSTT